MKILIIHNRYQQRGGEDTTFEQEVELLKQTEDVQTIIFQNRAGWKGAIQFFCSVWNIHAKNKIDLVIGNFKPDIVHVHNWHYAIGPLVVRTVHKKNIPIILTIQNYRLLCPSATLLHKDHLFLESIHASFPWKAIRKKVYRNSFIQTFWLAFIIWVHKMIGTWKMVDRYILQTELAKSVFAGSSLGTREAQFSVKPNFIKDPGISESVRGEYFLYIGRLSEEKGIDILLDAFQGSPHNLVIGGDGPLKDLVVEASKNNPRIQFLGLLNKPEVRERMCQCTALIFPSIWYEGMPLTLIEAFAAGTPVIASNLGAMSSMIQHGFNGMHFTAGDAGELSDKLNEWVQMNKGDKMRYSWNARASFEKYYTAGQNKEKLLSIYNESLKNISL